MVAMPIVVVNVDADNQGVTRFVKSMKPRCFRKTMSKEEMLEVIKQIVPASRLEIQFKQDGLDGLDHLLDLHNKHFLAVEFVSGLAANSVKDEWVLQEDRMVRFLALTDWFDIKSAFICNVLPNLEAVTMNPSRR